jgi:hypothetical protein
MDARRDDIASNQRAQIALEVLSPYRPWGAVSDLAAECEISRQAVYGIAAAGKRVLMTGLLPESHGPGPTEKTVGVDRNRLVRSMVVLTEVGVTQRDISHCPEKMYGPVSL